MANERGRLDHIAILREKPEAVRHAAASVGIDTYPNGTWRNVVHTDTVTFICNDRKPQGAPVEEIAAQIQTCCALYAMGLPAQHGLTAKAYGGLLEHKRERP